MLRWAKVHTPLGQACARRAGAGVFGVEMFMLEGGKLLLNEVAPRPHNSGHYTIEATSISQFEQHLRAILGWPLADVLPLAGARCSPYHPALSWNLSFCPTSVPGVSRALCLAGTKLRRTCIMSGF